MFNIRLSSWIILTLVYALIDNPSTLHGAYDWEPRWYASAQSNWQKASVVAVHGLAADPLQTWVAKKGEWNWLKNQLIEIIPDAQVWTFGYESNWTGDNSVDTRLSEVATSLVDAICEKVYSWVFRIQQALLSISRNFCPRLRLWFLSLIVLAVSLL